MIWTQPELLSTRLSSPSCDMDWLSEVYKKHYPHKSTQHVLVVQTKCSSNDDRPKPLHFSRSTIPQQNTYCSVFIYILKVICFAMSRSLDRLGETHTFITRTSNNFTSKKKRTSVIYLWTYQKLLIVLKFSVYRKTTNNVK